MPSTRSVQAPRAVSTSTGISPAGRAPALQHGEPVQPRQPEVEHHQVVVLGVAEEPGLLAVAGQLHGEAGGLPAPPEVARDPRIVLHRQGAHQSSSTSPRPTRIRPVTASTLASSMRPSRGDQLELVDILAALLLEFHLDHAGVDLLLDHAEDGGERQHLAPLQRLARALVSSSPATAGLAQMARQRRTTRRMRGMMPCRG